MSHASEGSSEIRGRVTSSSQSTKPQNFPLRWSGKCTGPMTLWISTSGIRGRTTIHPHTTGHGHNLHQLSINVWTGITSDPVTLVSSQHGDGRQLWFLSRYFTSTARQRLRTVHDHTLRHFSLTAQERRSGHPDAGSVCSYTSCAACAYYGHQPWTPTHFHPWRFFNNATVFKFVWASFQRRADDVCSWPWTLR